MRLKNILTILTLVLSVNLFAGVTPKNGNYHVNYTDIVIEPNISGFDVISRTYNSKATEIGIFGYGWGSDLETRLFAFPDGTLMVKENGTGMNIYYTSIFTTEDMLEQMIDQLIEVTIELGNLNNTPNAIIERRNKLRTNLAYRNSQWIKYVEKGILVLETDFSIGMEWESNQLGNEQIIKIENGYKRTGNRVVEEFDNNGNMSKYDKGNGYYFTIDYLDNKISKMNNADGTELIFTTNPEGFISSITFIDKVAYYKYDSNKNLIESTDAAGNIFKHTYDVHHNMTGIYYTDGDSRLMAYDPKTQKVTSVTNQEGKLTEYEYLIFYNDDGSKNDNHYGTKISKYDYEGNRNTSTFEYIEGTRVNGQRFNKMIKTIVNGIKSETHYDELCGRPISIEKDIFKTTFKYNNRCLVTEKHDADGKSIYLEYHPNFDKISKVTREGITSEFDYNEQGLLIYAKNNKTRNWMKLEYDSSGNILVMTHKKQELSFKYNKMNKPSEITIKGKGTVYYTYDANGDILNVDEDEKNLESEVNRAYQQLFYLVEPAKVDFKL